MRRKICAGPLAGVHRRVNHGTLTGDCYTQVWQIDCALRIRHMRDIAQEQTQFFKDIVVAGWDRLARPGKDTAQFKTAVQTSLHKAWADGPGEHREVWRRKFLYTLMYNKASLVLQQRPLTVKTMQALEPMLLADFVAFSDTDPWRERVADIYKIFVDVSREVSQAKNSVVTARVMSGVKKKLKSLLGKGPHNPVRVPLHAVLMPLIDLTWYPGAKLVANSMI